MKGQIINKYWRDKTSYGHMKNYGDKMWAWEFLRRNVEYQKFWRETLKKYKEIFAKSPAQVINTDAPRFLPAKAITRLTNDKR